MFVLALLVGAYLLLPFAGPLVALGLFSRIRTNDLEQHETRSRLRALIRDAPGLNLEELRHRSGLPLGTLLYHLNRLGEAHLVRCEMVGRERVYFLPEHDRPLRDAICVLRQPVKVRLLSYLQRRPGISQSELAAVAGISRPLANRYLHQLEIQGLIVSTRDWRRRLYSPGPAMGPYLAHAQARLTPTDPDLATTRDVQTANDASTMPEATANIVHASGPIVPSATVRPDATHAPSR